MLELFGNKSSFLKSDCIKLGKSRRYSILKRDCEIDGLSAVKLFVEENIDYNIFGLEPINTFPKKNNFIFKNLEMSSRLFSINIRKFIDYTGFNLKDFCKEFKIDYKKAVILLGRGDAFPISICLSIERATKVCLPLWFSKSLDLGSIAKNWLLNTGKKRSIPSYYVVEEGSKVRLFETAVLFSDQELGAEYTNYILSYLQVTRDLFSYPDKNISLKLFRDFHYCLRCFDVNDSFFIKMGSQSVFLNKISRLDFRQRFEPLNVKDLLLKLGEQVAPRLDKNYTYEAIKDEEGIVVIESKPVQVDKLSGSYETALYRFGHIAYIPTFFDLPAISLDKSFFDYDEAKDIAIFTYYI